MRGETVKELLKRSGTTLNDVAEAMGESPQSLQSLLRANDIKTGVLERIAAAINKSLYFFYENSGNDISQITDNNSGVITNNIGAKDNTTTTNNTTNSYSNCDKESVSCSLLGKAFDEIAEQRKLVSKAQEQIDRLITLLEKTSKT